MVGQRSPNLPIQRAARAPGWQPRIPEKTIQYQGVCLLRSVGGNVYELGTRRSRKDHSHGTHQTPGVADVLAFLPPPPLRPAIVIATQLWWEVKAEGGRMRPEQVAFRLDCERARQAHVAGGLDPLYAFLIDGGWLKPDNVPHYRRPQETA